MKSFYHVRHFLGKEKIMLYAFCAFYHAPFIMNKKETSVKTVDEKAICMI